MAQEGAPAGNASSAEAFAQALHLYRTGKFDAAESRYQALLAQTPNSAEAYAGLTRTYLRQQKLALAAETAERAAKVLGGSANLHTLRGELFFRQGKIEAAGEEFQKALASNPSDARALWSMGRVDEALSLHAQAKKMFAAAHQIDPDDPDILRDWMPTLPRAEHAKALQQYLAAETDDDPEERAALERNLGLLKALLVHAPMPCNIVNNVPNAEENLRMMLDGPQRLRGYGLDVKINGRASRLLLDTGASSLLIGRKLAEKAGVERLSDSQVKGVGDSGSSGGYYAYAGSLKIGELEFRDCLIRVSDKPLITDLDGLIGADLFGNYLVKIDFPGKKLRLSSLPPRTAENASPPSEVAQAPDSNDDRPPDAFQPTELTEVKDFTHAFRFGHMLLLPTRVDEAPARLFMIDTGASENSVSFEAARDAGLLYADTAMQTSGLGGAVKNSRLARNALLRFARARQENQNLLTFDSAHLSKLITTEVSGMLGIHMLQDMTLTIDYRDGLVDFGR